MPLAEWTTRPCPRACDRGAQHRQRGADDGERPCDHPLRVRPEPLHPGAVQDQRPHAPVRNCRPQHGQTLAGAGERPYQRVTDRRPQPLHGRAVQDQRPQAATRHHRPQCRQALAHVRERPNERAPDCRPQPVHRSAVPDKRGVDDPRRPRRQPRHARRRTCHDPTRRGTHSRPHPGHAGAVARQASNRTRDRLVARRAGRLPALLASAPVELFRPTCRSRTRRARTASAKPSRTRRTMPPDRERNLRRRLPKEAGRARRTRR